MPSVLMVILWRNEYSSKLRWFTETLVFFLAILFAYVTARWDFTSYYLRILLLPLFALVSYVAYRKIIPKESSNSYVHRIRENAANIALIIFLGWLNIIALNGYLYPGEAVELTYPLRDGVYYVGGGGTSRWINGHQAFPPQNYALDIVRLNVFGNRAIIGDQADLQRYAIFGNPIYSPCSGTVVHAVYDQPDQLPPNTDVVNLAGNYVLIACYDVEILLAHMKQGSIVVTKGDMVEEGEILGAVGNSGNTSQPHLHIHAERGGISGKILDGEGVPIIFGNRFLARNSLFTGGD